MPVDFINASKSYDLCVLYGMYYIAEGKKVPNIFWMFVLVRERKAAHLAEYTKDWY